MSTPSAAQLAESRNENRIAAQILFGVLVFVLLVAAAVYVWGLFGLTMIGLAGAALVLSLIIAYAAGF